jgi:D-glycero-D-manno-heptose 1,7-bisphosphate phosphatase
MKEYKLVIFDRDNTLIKDLNGYVHKVSDLQWFEGVPEMLNRIRDAGIKIAVATNQSGVARGLYSETEVVNLHEYMNSSIGAHGAIDLFRYCPHHPDGRKAEYVQICSCRKPEPGMILEILAELSVKESECIIFGDSESDCLSGINVGIDSQLVAPGEIVEAVKKRLGI